MKTIFEGIYGDEVTIKTDNKRALKKALRVVFGDNADCYEELIINTGNGYELGLSSKYAMEVFENL